MAQWTEYQDCYEVGIRRGKLKNIQEVGIVDTGIFIKYGDRPSKTGHPKLLSISFMKSYWDFDGAAAWFIGHEIHIIPQKHLGKQIPIIDLVIKDYQYFSSWHVTGEASRRV